MTYRLFSMLEVSANGPGSAVLDTLDETLEDAKSRALKSLDLTPIEDPEAGGTKSKRKISNFNIADIEGKLSLFSMRNFEVITYFFVCQ